MTLKAYLSEADFESAILALEKWARSERGKRSSSRSWFLSWDRRTDKLTKRSYVVASGRCALEVNKSLAEGAQGQEEVEEDEDEEALSSFADPGLEGDGGGGSEGEEADEGDEGEDNTSSGQNAATVEVHVVWDNVYRVPSLLFRASRDTGKALELHELLSGKPSALAAVQRGGGYGSPAVTAAEHPHIGSTFYAVHPCNTAAGMGEVLGAGGALGTAMGAEAGRAEEAAGAAGAAGAGAASGAMPSSPLRYLVLWLSVVAPLAGLEIQPKLAASCLRQSEKCTAD